MYRLLMVSGVSIQMTDVRGQETETEQQLSELLIVTLAQASVL